MPEIFDGAEYDTEFPEEKYAKLTEIERYELKEALELQEFYLEKQNAEQIKYMDNMFHKTLYKLSGSMTFFDVLVPLHKKVQKYRKASLESKSRAAASVKEHRKVYEAIVAGDAKQAAEYAKQHVENAYNHIKGKD